MIYIVALSIIMTLLIIYLVYVSNIKFMIKLVCFPVMLGLSGLAGHHYIINLGAPQSREIPDKFEYRHHMVMVDDTILVWLRVDDEERLIRVAYDRELAKALEEAKEMQEGGGYPEVGGGEELLEDPSNQRPWKVEDVTPTGAESETK